MDRYGGASTEYLFICLHNQSNSMNSPINESHIQYKVWHKLNPMLAIIIIASHINFFSITFFGGAGENRTRVLIAIHISQQYYEYLYITSFKGSIHLSLFSMNNNGCSFSTAIIITIVSTGIPVLSSYATA